MAEVVNLRLKRKQAARAAGRAAGDEQAARHGVTTAEKSLVEARADKARRDLDLHQCDTDG